MTPTPQPRTPCDNCHHAFDVHALDHCDAPFCHCTYYTPPIHSQVEPPGGVSAGSAGMAVSDSTAPPATTAGKALLAEAFHSGDPGYGKSDRWVASFSPQEITDRILAIEAEAAGSNGLRASNEQRARDVLTRVDSPPELERVDMDDHPLGQWLHHSLGCRWHRGDPLGCDCGLTRAILDCVCGGSGMTDPTPQPPTPHVTDGSPCWCDPIVLHPPDYEYGPDMDFDEVTENIESRWGQRPPGCRQRGGDTMIDTDTQKGVYGKYRVERLGGTPGKHDDCWYYVLDARHDKFTVPALRAYIAACRDEFPVLAADLERVVARIYAGLDPRP